MATNMVRDKDNYHSNGYTRTSQRREEKISEDLMSGHFDGMATEFLSRSLSRIPVQLRPYKIKPHILELGKILWQEAVVAVHVQDDRLSDREREFLAAIATRLNGVRGVL